MGDDGYPSFCNLRKEPLIRAKASADGSEWLVIACNPYNKGVQQVQVRNKVNDAPMLLELIGDYPVISRFKIQRSDQ